MKRTVLSALGLCAVGAMIAWAQDAAFGNQPVVAHQGAIVLKGEGALVDGNATVTLPAWFEGQAAASGRVAVACCKGGGSPIWVSAVAGGQFMVSTNENGSPTQAFTWIVIANRN